MNVITNQNVHAIEARLLKALRKQIHISLMEMADTPSRASGGVCQQVWEELDTIVEKTNHTPSITEVRKLASKKKWNQNNARVEYYRWRKANNITGRIH